MRSDNGGCVSKSLLNRAHHKRDQAEQDSGDKDHEQELRASLIG
jgi:hypothetical protein